MKRLLILLVALGGLAMATSPAMAWGGRGYRAGYRGNYGYRTYAPYRANYGGAYYPNGYYNSGYYNNGYYNNGYYNNGYGNGPAYTAPGVIVTAPGLGVSVGGY